MNAAPCRQAVVLVGGEGTRLRPITSLMPKPVAPMVGRPFVGYILDNLARHGVERVVFSSGYLAEVIEATIGDGAQYGVHVSYVVEEEPLGTAGAIKNAQSALAPGRFLACNGDVLSDVDLTRLGALHAERGAMGTIYLHAVDDPRRYGLVRTRTNGQVIEFLEKPGLDHPGPYLINAGVYVLEPEVLELIPAGRMVSIEREVFPRLASAGSLYGLQPGGYWRDIGTPESYIAAHFDILERSVHTVVANQMGERYVYLAPTAVVEEGARVVPPAYVAEGAAVGANAQIGPLTFVGEGSAIAEGAVVAESVLQERVCVAEHAQVRRSVVVRDSRVGAGCQLSNAILGEGCRIGAGNELASGITLAAGTVLPDASVSFRELDQDGGA